MKRCPECRRDYYDETLLYCLDDGSPLVDGPGVHEPVTQIFEEPSGSIGATQHQIHATDDIGSPTTAGTLDKKRPRRFSIAIVTTAVLLICALGGSVGYWRYASKADTKKAPGSMKVTRLTSHGQVGLPAISPDGKYVIYTLWDAGKGSLWLRQVSTNSAVPLLQPSSEDVGFGGRTFSRNGEMIYYVYFDKQNESGVLQEMPTLGGTPRKVLSDIASAITFAPNGRSFAFLRNDPKDGSTQLMVASLDDAEQRAVASRKGGDWFSGDPSWSPDGKTIACGTATEIGGYSISISSFPVEGGDAKPITEHKWTGNISQVAWLGDGSGLLAAAGDETGASQIWHISYPGGDVRQVTSDLNGYNYVSVTTDSSALVTRQEDATDRIWTYSQGVAKQISNGKYEGANGLDWTPDGKIVFTVRNGENADLSMMRSDGSQSGPLISDASGEGNPCVTRDGRYIIFVSDRSERVPHIFRMAIDGSGIKQLTFGDMGQGQPRCSPDSRSVIFGTYVTGPRTEWRVSIDGGDPTRISERPLQDCFFLGDGNTQLFCLFIDEQSQPPKARAAEVSVDTGEFVRTLDIPTRTRTMGVSPDGKSYVYSVAENGTDNLWTQQLAGGQPKQLTNFKPEAKMTALRAYSWSPDGKQLAVVREITSNDVVLIKDFR